ncbi:unnamed protein product [Litomosoides sigmodontis]|uniref:Uncharacterized protein n=1 Tax=Litomosoides sigmodontis TaxID=42156 RepID=A0A3P6THI6_LITSI|nr:unnamed protein product [Litomosoides sigmodontis]
MSETCRIADSTPSQLDEIYLSCGSDQYTAGVRIIDDGSEAFSVWQLLCCSGKSIKIQKDDCIDTKFLNEYHRSSTFFTGTQIIRKWQAVHDDNDLRWWLQVCPVDVRDRNEIQYDSSPRARRQIPLQWTRSRFDSIRADPNFMRRNAFSGINHLQTFPNTPILQFESEQRTARNSKKLIANSNMKGAFVTEKILPQLSTLKPLTDIFTSSIRPAAFATVKEDVAIDYYDVYDENFDKRKHDGLSIAQAALPSHEKQIYKTTTTTDGPAFLLSRDEDSLTIGMQHDTQNGGSSSRLKLQRFGPKPSRPNASQPVSTSFKLGNPGAIQQMFQFFGLCKSHEL